MKLLVYLDIVVFKHNYKKSVILVSNLIYFSFRDNKNCYFGHGIGNFQNICY